MTTDSYNFAELSCRDFVRKLESKAPVPGGGGAAARAGAIGTALGKMVGSLTVGKKKYADVEEEILALKARAGRLQEEFLELMKKDAEAFAPLSAAYRLPAAAGEEKAYKDRVMEECRRAAAAVPIEIMRKCEEAIGVTGEFAEKGTRIAVSDAGVAALLLKAALRSAALNVFINTASMKDRKYAGELEREADRLIAENEERAERINSLVLKKIRSQGD